ncbi:peptidase [Corynebacterium phocae]|uniref:Peptidase n=1 Tax=Corynebacterium phocae TaxID=161895 RepID=A0A1L7D1M3_9CORY|nr:P1 family peptidase [Corynebacterium phocae]APT92004.1 peptidase [Corynebacterium phocae]KAA8726379.1 P1 family peptidase [Corynebacterium phocae]
MFQVGHCDLADTGVTVIYCGPQGALAAVDVRGGGPGTRETDLLEPHNTVERVHAVVLSGGSAFGLAAADGAMRELARHDIGFAVLGEDKPGPRVPIVPAAVIFDLLVGQARYPSAEDGAAALRAAMAADDTSQGSVGAGIGATAGRLRGGLGRAQFKAGKYQISAVVVANPVGEVVGLDGKLFAAPEKRVDPTLLKERTRPKLNTTIGAIMTDAPVTKAQAKRLAMMAHDGIAHAVRPAHTPLDGDTIFALSSASRPTGVDAMELLELGQAAAQAVATAIVSAVTQAEAGIGATAFREIAVK